MKDGSKRSKFQTFRQFRYYVLVGNAAYHNVQLNMAQTSFRKSVMIYWLPDRDIPFSDRMCKAELYSLTKLHKRRFKILKIHALLCCTTSRAFQSSRPTERGKPRLSSKDQHIPKENPLKPFCLNESPLHERGTEPSSFCLLSTDPTFVEIPDPSMMTSPCKLEKRPAYIILLQNNFFVVPQ